MTEIIRYSRIGKEDINFGMGTFEVRLADGRVVTLSQVDLGVLLSDATISTRTVTLDNLTVTNLTADSITTLGASPTSAFTVPEKADPASPVSGELWINSGGLVIEYADDAATPTRHALVGDDTTQTLTNKTLTTPVIASLVSGGQTLTVPAATDTLVARNTMDTLTNKTLTAPTISAPVFSGTITGTYTIGGTPTFPVGIATLGTPQASTSGTAIDFTSIPSGVKRIMVMGNGVSTNGTSDYLLQIGDAGGIETSGYLGTGSQVLNGATPNGANYTTGFGIFQNSAANVIHFIFELVLVNSSTNTWMAKLIGGHSNSATSTLGAGSKSLTGTLDRLRITTVTGTPTFDAGEINILYE